MDTYTKTRVANMTAISNSGFAKKECEPIIPEDNTKGSAAQWTAQIKDVEVPRKSILLFENFKFTLI